MATFCPTGLPKLGLTTAMIPWDQDCSVLPIPGYCHNDVIAVGLFNVRFLLCKFSCSELHTVLKIPGTCMKLNCSMH